MFPFFILILLSKTDGNNVDVSTTKSWIIFYVGILKTAGHNSHSCDKLEQASTAALNKNIFGVKGSFWFLRIYIYTDDGLF